MTEPFKGGLFIGGHKTLVDNPLATHIAVIVAQTAVIEYLFAELLVRILGASADSATVAMYLALTGSQSRFAALRGAAEQRLSEGDNKELNKLIKKVRNTKGYRNDIAHALWGGFEVANTLILIDPREQIKYRMTGDQLRSKLEELRANGAPIPKQYAVEQELFAHSERMVGTGTVYHESDFVSIENELDDAIVSLRAFTHKVGQKLS